VLIVIIAEEVRTALLEGRGVVALESTIISHGLPSDSSARVAREIEDAVRESGAAPATIAIVGGRVRIGLDDNALDQIATDASVVKSSIRDLASVIVNGGLGATTVASTAYLAHHVGIRVFATGGLGGVHRGAGESFDESADLTALAHTPVALVCAGVKSILDVGATLERLETLNVTVLGYGTKRFPGFYLADSGFALDWSVDSPKAAARVINAQVNDGGVVIANPVSLDAQLDPALHAQVLSEGLIALERQDVRGKAVTPFLLDYFRINTGGASLQVNLNLVRANARLATQIAAAL